VHAFDMSDTAIKLVLKHENYTPERVGAYACDILKENPKKLVDSLYSFCTMIFFLSAIPPDQVQSVLKKIDDVMIEGGLIFFRDYGLYDMAMIRNHKKRELIQ